MRQIPIKPIKPKFPVSERALETVRSTMEKQNRYGLDKYGKPLDYLDNYDWLKMLTEELTDGLQYLQCEIDRKQKLTNLLQIGFKSDNPREYIAAALELLTIEGTGK